MKSITRLTKFLQTRRSLFMIWVAILNQAASAQTNGYWESIGFSSRWSDGVSSIAANDSNIFLGSPIARWNGKIFVPFEGGPIYGLASEIGIVANDLYVGGAFTTVGNIPANNIAKWNLVTKSWAVLGSHDNNGVDGTVTALAAHGRNLYVASEFTDESGIRVTNIAKWNIVTNVWVPLGKSINGKVHAMAASEGELYVGGIFTSAGGVPANNIAKWGGKEWCALGSGVDLEGKPLSGIPHVNAIAIFGQDVYVGGYFTKAGDIDANAIATWNMTNKSWSVLSSGNTNGVYYYFNSTESNRTGNVYALAANDHAIYVGGTFYQAGDQSANNIAKWDPVNNTWSSLGSGLQGQAFAIATQGKDVYVGGGFTYAGGKRSDRFAIWHEPKNHAPLWSKVLELSFHEDDSLLYPIRNWFEYVTDADQADSTLFFRVFSSPKVKAVKRGDKFIFTATLDWFGTSKLQLLIKDRQGLADTTTLIVKVNAVNDPPLISGLPDSLSFRNNSFAVLNLWAFVHDVETPDSVLSFTLTANKTGLGINLNQKTGQLKLTAPNFSGKARLYLTVKDWKNAVARDTISVRVESSTVTHVAAGNEQLPKEFVLLQNYPNPFSANGTFGNPTTLIRFGLPQETEVKLEILNLAGQHVATLLDGRKAAGYHEVRFEASNLASGMYFYRLTAPQAGLSVMKKLMLMR